MAAPVAGGVLAPPPPVPTAAIPAALPGGAATAPIVPTAATPAAAMGMEPVVHTIGSIACVLFFVADFYIAYTLNVIKQNHPAIDDAAPDDDDDVAAGVHVDVGGSGRLGAHSSSGSGMDGPIGGPQTLAVLSLIAQTVTGSPSITGRKQRVHVAVVAAAMAAPFFCLLQILAPASMRWSMFHTPAWLQFLCIVPGLGLSMVYALRAHRVSDVGELSKTQWLAVMWFRLDVGCAFAAILLLAWGDWVVAACLLVVDIYLAQRLLATEKKLVHAVRGTQLLPDEFGSRDDLASHHSGNTGPVDHGATAHSVARPRVNVTAVGSAPV